MACLTRTVCDLGGAVRFYLPTTLIPRTDQNQRQRLGIAALAALLAGSSFVSVSLSATHDPRVQPTVAVDPMENDADIPLPVESLRAVHGLDLKQPAKVRLPIVKQPLATKQVEEPTGPALLTMPSLVAPANMPVKATPATTNTGNTANTATPHTTTPTTPPAAPSAEVSPSEQPPAPPEAFTPEWRASGRAGNGKGPVTSEVKPPMARVVEAPVEQTPVSSPAKTQAEAVVETAPSTTAETVVEDVAPAKPLRPLTRNQIFLRNKMRKVLAHYYRKPLNSRDNDAWEVMHGMLAYELHSRIRSGGPSGEPVTAIGWLCYNNPCKNKQLMRLNDEGKIRAQYGVGLQGHMGQFLAMLAQCNVERTYPIRVDDKEFTIEDLIVSEQDTAYPNTELTFKLIGLMHYLPSDTQWVNDRGEQWSIERLIEEELKQPIRGAACGGTHRLAGLSLAVRKREARGEPIDGVWLRAKQFTAQYEQYCYRLQNSDGSFSTSWFQGPGKEKDIGRRCRTTGHQLEWMMYQVRDEQLTSNRVVSATNYLTNLLYSESTEEWEIGPLCHALHALALYDERVFQPHDQPEQTAGNSGQGNTNSARRTNGQQRRR
jgi:hypothetical protein